MSEEHNIKSEEQFVEELASCLANESLALFAGAGFTMSAGFPSWKELLIKSAIVPVSPSNWSILVDEVQDLAAYAQYFANEFKVGHLKNSITRYLKKQEIRDSKLLSAVKSLNFKTIWTTNYDHVIEEKIADGGKSIDVFYDEKKLIEINNGQKIKLFKIHGDVDDSSSIIITKSELENEPSLMMTFLKRDLVAFNFLFLGYSFTDQVILKQLSDIRCLLGDGMRKHYAVIYDPPKDDESGDDPQKEESRRKIRDYRLRDFYTRYNVVALVKEDSDEIVELLERVRMKAIERNVFISGSLDNPTPEEEKAAYEFCSCLGAELMKSNMNLKVYTGMGTNVGRYVSSGVLFSKTVNSDVYQFTKRCVMLPFANQLKAEQKKAHREALLSMCHFAIFLYGGVSRSESGGPARFSDGVQQEFELAKKAGLHIIPVGATEYQSGKIWEEVKREMDNKESRCHVDFLRERINKLGITIEQKWSKIRSELLKRAGERKQKEILAKQRDAGRLFLLKKIKEAQTAACSSMAGITSPYSATLLKGGVRYFEELIGNLIVTNEKQPVSPVSETPDLGFSRYSKPRNANEMLTDLVGEQEMDILAQDIQWVKKRVNELGDFVKKEWTKIMKDVEKRVREGSYGYLKEHIDQLKEFNREAGDMSSAHAEMARTVVQIIQNCIKSHAL